MDRAEQMREADPRVDILRDEYYGDAPLDEYEMRDALRVLSKLDAIRALPAVTPAPVTGPDWVGFGKAAMENWPYGDIDGFQLQDLAEKYGLIRKIPGGFDPEKHEDVDGVCPEPGDEWYGLTYDPADGVVGVQQPAPTMAAALALPEIKALVEAARGSVTDMQRAGLLWSAERLNAALRRIAEARHD